MINDKVIAIDARMIEMSGIGTYIQHLMGQEIYDYAFGNEEEIRKYDKDVKVIPYDACIYGIKEQLFFPNKAVKEAGIELVHFPHYNVPISFRGKYVVTVHDLTHILFPEFLGMRVKYYYAKFLMSRAIRKATHIFTVSENSKKDICETFHVDPQKISITYNAVDDDFIEKKTEEYDYLYDKYEIPRNKKILLYVGNLKPHKNLHRLLEAVSEMENKKGYILLLVGKDFKSTSLDDDEKRLGIGDIVIHTGIVDKAELVDLYNLADLFVFPSLYEGFGIPPLEAMASGTPVVCSNNSSIPEVVGNAAVLFNPYKVNDIKDKIERVVNNNDIMEKMSENGLTYYKRYSWEKTTEIIQNTIKQVMSRY